jgi:hypothetical protein
MGANLAKFGDGLEFDRGSDELCECKRRFRTIGGMAGITFVEESALSG